VNGDEEDPPPAGARTPAPEAAAQPAEGRAAGTPPPRAWRARNMRLDLAVGAAVLLVYAAAQILLLQGPHPFDPARYYQAAVRFPHLEADLWTLRIGLVVPVRLAVLAFGPSEASLYAVPLAMGLLLTAAVYGSMLMLFHDRVVAAATALATVLNAVFLYRSSLLFPDTAAAATFTAGFFSLLIGADGGHARTNRWRTIVPVAAAGLFFGWTYLIREFSLLLVPAVVAAALLLGYGLRRFLILASGALTALVAEFAYGLNGYGDPFIHLHKLLDRNDRPVSRGDAPIVHQVLGKLNNPIDTLLVFPRLLVSFRSGWILIALLLVYLVALAWFRDRRLWLFAPWLFLFWATMALLGLGSLPSGRWIVNITNIRYWYPVLPVLVMGGFAGLALIAGKYTHRIRGPRLSQGAAAVLAAVVVVVPGVADFRMCAATGVWRNDPIQRWHDLRTWLATSEAQRYTVLWTDSKTLRLVPAFTSTAFGRPLWHGTLEPFRETWPLVSKQTSDTTAILIHKDRVRHPKETLQRFRADWAPVFMSADGNMVVLAHKPASGGSVLDERQAWSLPTEKVKSAPSCGLDPYVTFS
jgi:hypothetical protein